MGKEHYLHFSFLLAGENEAAEEKGEVLREEWVQALHGAEGWRQLTIPRGVVNPWQEGKVQLMSTHHLMNPGSTSAGDAALLQKSNLTQTHGASSSTCSLCMQILIRISVSSRCKTGGGELLLQGNSATQAVCLRAVWGIVETRQELCCQSNCIFLEEWQQS